MTSPKTLFARRLRRDETDAEYRLWYELKNRRLNGHKFVRQCPIGPCIADFLCRSRRLVVEVDGSQHAEAVRDLVRTMHLNAQGYSVLRFWNEEVLRERQAVLETILAVVEGGLTLASNGGPGFGLRFFPAGILPDETSNFARNDAAPSRERPNAGLECEVAS